MAEKKSKPHQTRSFEQLVADAQLSALKPYIKGVCKEESLILGREILVQLSRLTLQHLAQAQLRSMAVESLLKEKLGVTDDELADRISIEEDKEFGYEEADEVKEGYMVRAEVESELGPEAKRQPLNGKLCIRMVNQVDFNSGKIQTEPEIEKALLGHKKGNHVLVALDDDKAETKANYKLVIKRISRKVPNAEGN